MNGWRNAVTLLQQTVVNTFGQGDDGDGWEHRPANGGPVSPFFGIHRAPHEELALDLQTTVSSTSPILDARLADFAQAPVQGDLVRQVGTGQDFTILEVQPDGEGMVRMLLVKDTDGA